MYHCKELPSQNNFKIHILVCHGNPRNHVSVCAFHERVMTVSHNLKI